MIVIAENGIKRIRLYWCYRDKIRVGWGEDIAIANIIGYLK